METRDIVNAPQLKQSILLRSQKRQDPPEITQWLIKKFFEHLIKHFNPVFHVNSVAAWTMCQLPQDIPAWFLSKVNDPASTMLYIDPYHEQLLALEKPLLEYLNAKMHSTLKTKFMKMTYAQVLEAWQKDHDAMRRKIAKGHWESHAHAFSKVLSVDTGCFVEITANENLLRQELAYESRYMQHCLGEFENLRELSGGYAEYYVQEKHNGRLRYFSLRDPNNKPHVTISLEWNGENWCIEQIKGKQNDVPIDKYRSDVLRFLNHVQPICNQNTDCLNMGILYCADYPIELSQDQKTTNPYVMLSEIDDLTFKEQFLFNHTHLVGLVGEQSVVMQHGLIASDLSQEITEPLNPFIETIKKFTEQSDDEPFDLNAVLPLQGPVRSPWWEPFYKPYAKLVLFFMNTLGGLAWLGFIFKIIGLLLGLPILIFSKVLKPKKTGVLDWVIVTGLLIYHRNHLLGALEPSITCEIFTQNEKRLKQHLKDMLYFYTHHVERQRQQRPIDLFLKSYFSLAFFSPYVPNQVENNPTTIRQILVFHHIQKIFSLRLLVQFEGLEEQVAWQYMLASAKIIQDCCESRQDMGQKYVQGRALYLIHRYRDEQNYDHGAQADLNLVMSLNLIQWDSLAWNLDLQVSSLESHA
ncbi:cytoplasmic protein [Acinetobacter sp. MD2(2019)]|uniref:cytoplasmic protein n=1 Tax=Acinetobacter sp. MD2(2019) TaxID=2605273 RepID=UPI002D1E785A|nr:cytoplasmic protein [Acinetobacter sp. MD2(2019)]MEB3753772.1 cytoplasmic protein [Acinetobacter sp. MD2(2019)]